VDGAADDVAIRSTTSTADNVQNRESNGRVLARPDIQRSERQRERTTAPGRQYAFTHLVGKLPLTTPMSATWNVHGTGALGHLQTLAHALTLTLERRLGPDNGRSLAG